MLKTILLLFCVCGVYSYFTLPGKCPENVHSLEDFSLADIQKPEQTSVLRLIGLKIMNHFFVISTIYYIHSASSSETDYIAEFHGKWYQAYYYASDGQKKNNCCTIEMKFQANKDGYPTLSFNQSRVDRGLFHRYSLANIPSPKSGTPSSSMELVFEYENAPRRLKTRKYQFQVLATNYNYYATTYTCQYSPLIDKHFIYIWILSRNPILNDVSKELALKPLQQIGVEADRLVRDDQSKCQPKYFDNFHTEPTTFKHTVKI